MSLDVVFRKIREGDTHLRDRVFNDNIGLVWACVKRYAGLLDKEDLFQLGAIGLLKAIDRFEPSYGVAFSTYAFPHIMGEIRRYLRDNAPIKISRRQKEIALAAQRVSRELAASTGSDPPVSEVASRLGLDADAILEALEAVRPVLYLEDLSGYSQERREDPGEPGEVVLREAHRIDLEDALNSLDHDLQKVIRGRFYRGRTQQELAEEIGVSQAHVCRLERKALLLLRAHLEGLKRPAEQ